MQGPSVQYAEKRDTALSDGRVVKLFIALGSKSLIVDRYSFKNNDTKR